MFKKQWYLQMSKFFKSVEQEHAEQPDIQFIVEKHGVGRHDLIFLATQVARLSGMTPKETLNKLSEIDNLEDYIVQLKFNSEEVDKY